MNEQRIAGRPTNKARLALYVLAAMAVIGGVLYCSARLYVSPSLDQLLLVEQTRTRTIVSKQHPFIVVPPARSAVEDAWADMRTEMRRYCASDKEIEGVCSAADLQKWYKGRLYALPVYVRPAWVESHKIWVFGYVWESGDVLDGRYSSHRMTCVFDASAPYELLRKEGCL